MKTCVSGIECKLMNNKDISISIKLFDSSHLFFFYFFLLMYKIWAATSALFLAFNHTYKQVRFIYSYELT